MKMKDDFAWCLATRLGETYFRKLHTSRVDVIGSIDTGTTVEAKHYQAALVWHAVGKTQDLMTEFYTREFKNHDVISHEMTNYILRATYTRDVHSADDKKMEMKFTEFKEAQKQSVSSVRSALETKFNTVETTATGAKSATNYATGKAESALSKANIGLLKQDVETMPKAYKKEGELGGQEDLATLI